MEITLSITIKADKDDLTALKEDGCDLLSKLLPLQGHKQLKT